MTNAELIEKALTWLDEAEELACRNSPVEGIQLALDIARGYEEASTELRQLVTWPLRPHRGSHDE